MENPKIDFGTAKRPQIISYRYTIVAKRIKILFRSAGRLGSVAASSLSLEHHRPAGLSQNVTGPRCEGKCIFMIFWFSPSHLGPATFWLRPSGR